MSISILSYTSALSIIIAFAIGMVRYPGILPAYRPFLFFVAIATINELLNTLLIRWINNNVINSNLYVLIEYAVLLLIFYRWDIRTHSRVYYLLFSTGIFIWIVDNFLLHSLMHINAIFRIVYSLIILLLSIRQVLKLIASEKRSLVRNPVFLICMSFIFYFSFKAFFETFYILQPPLSQDFYFNLFILLWIINLLANLVYAIAIIWMPRKQEFTIP